MTITQVNTLAQQVIANVRGEQLGIALYGSQARGTSRADSDIDVLQLVPSRPKSYSIDNMNVTSYTPEHLTYLASRGSLFVRHLVDECVILDDPHSAISTALAAYREPSNYAGLKVELRVLLEAITKADPGHHQPLLNCLARYAVRSALYVRVAEIGSPTFDLEVATSIAGRPTLASRLRNPDESDAVDLVPDGIELLDVSLPDGTPQSMYAIAIWSIGRFPLVSSQLEHLIAGNAKIDYSLLTLPTS